MDIADTTTEPEVSAELLELNFNRLYADDYCDENNWSQCEAVILRNGTVIPMCPEDDYRNLACIQESYVNTPAEQRWDRVRLEALRSIAVDARLFNIRPIYISGNASAGLTKTVALDFDELVQKICDDVPGRLADMYTLVAGNGVQPKNWRDDCMRKTLANVFEYFRHSEVVPFTTTRVSPYSYRCFDLRDCCSSDISENSGILLVDIHT